MTLNYEITPSEHLEMLRVRFGVRARLGRIVVDFVGIAFGALCWHLFGETWIVVIAVFVGLAIAQIFQPSILHRRIYNRNPQLFEMRRVTFTQEGIKSETATGTIEVKWTAFQKFKETSNLFLAYQTKDVVGIVPKRAFANSEELERFRELLASKMPRE
jgi:hypothetical protein